MPNSIDEFGLPLQRLLKMTRAEKFPFLVLTSRHVHRQPPFDSLTGHLNRCLVCSGLEAPNGQHGSKQKQLITVIISICNRIDCLLS